MTSSQTMAFRFEELDDGTRTLMVQELERDLEIGTFHLSSRLSRRGCVDLSLLLSEALTSGDPGSLAADLREQERLLPSEPRRLRDGRTILAKMPSNAAEALAEGEFNRFYIRAICLRALERGQREVQVYRAKVVREPRPGSERRIGTWVPAWELLEDLRRHSSSGTPALGVPGGPGSGISVRLAPVTEASGAVA